MPCKSLKQKKCCSILFCSLTQYSRRGRHEKALFTEDARLG